MELIPGKLFLLDSTLKDALVRLHGGLGRAVGGKLYAGIALGVLGELVAQDGHLEYLAAVVEIGLQLLGCAPVVHLQAWTLVGGLLQGPPPPRVSCSTFSW